MKTAVLDFLKKRSENPSEDFNTGFALLQKTPGVQQGTLRNYNNQGYTPQSLENIRYDLQKAHEISDLDIHNHEIEIPEENPIIVGKGYDEKLFIVANQDLFTNILKDMNDTEKQGFKLVDQYPFLKEEDCPAELKALAWDSVSAFHAFKDAHTELFEKVVMPENTQLTNEEIYDIAFKLLEDFEINREIHTELEHYAKTKTILAEHPDLEKIKRERELDALTAQELSRKIGNLKSNISKKNKKLAENKKLTAEQKEELSLEIKNLEEQKADLDARLKAKQ
ncbi:hypothetical protein ACFO4P_17115 [Epilithonimonas pallida]|uniref:Uncharacterized protein n=1 Tax=Epilithonimonas pallida TaxID=373671 RepID=A0ABY1R4H7_9FLAO|nr:hypothetical protein [Epilithonimonas pallida]SMP94709.1 hypothetical protein SAMN05421679_106108 [Epilithonimonas pallida]